jgi:hypothetical protein
MRSIEKSLRMSSKDFSPEERLARARLWARPPYRELMIQPNLGAAVPKEVGRGIARLPSPQMQPTPPRPSGGTVFHNPGDAPSGTTMSSNGGAVLPYAQILYFFWGSAWQNTSLSPGVGDIFVALEGLDDRYANPRTNYFSGLLQYGVGGPGGTGPVSGGFMSSGPPVIIPTNPPNNPFSVNDVANEMTAILNNATLDIQLGLNNPEYGPANFFVFFMPPGYPTTGAFGAHTFTNDQYGKRWPFAYLSYGTLAQITAVFTHELVETMTDPYGDAWQVNPRNPTSWNEIGDVCASAALVNGVTVTSYFSGIDGACIVPSPPPPPPPALPPGDYQIDCVQKVQHWNGTSYISHVGGPGNGSGRWLLPESEVVNLINTGGATFYTLEGGRRANVMVVRWYLETVADNFTPNNLDSLPSC